MSKGCCVSALDAPKPVAQPIKKPPVTRVDLKLGKIKVRITSAENIKVTEEDGGIVLKIVE